MPDIQIVSAGAGSGKTYRLAEIVFEAVRAGELRPEALLATTFTRKAAAELAERLRVKLLEAGRPDDARALGAARVGTLHAVCQGLVMDFCLELGLSPELRVMDEDEAAEALARSLSGAVGREAREEAQGLARGWPDFQLDGAVKAVVTRARENGLGPEALRASAERSVALLGELFPGAAADGAALDRALLDALEGFVGAAEGLEDGTKTTRIALDTCRRTLDGLRQGLRPGWNEWLALQKLGAGKRSGADALLAPVREAARAHADHPALRVEGERLIRLVMHTAAGALDAHARDKRAAGLLDFTDLEVLALGLLGRPGVRADLEGTLDLVVVDEFQDTSPLQLGIVLSLAGLARKSVWVGDQKQAIYGFRGTDPRLMDAAVEAILGGAEPEKLGKSFRSRPGLVRLVSELFAPAFAANGIPEERVRLEPACAEPPGRTLGPELERWELGAKNIPGDTQALAQGVTELLADPSARVRAPGTGEVRAIGPGDVAVLCRENTQCDAVAGALEARGVRVSRELPGLLETLEVQAALAGLRLWVDPLDCLAAATVLRLLRFPDRPDGWLALALERKPEGLAGEEPVRGLLALREERPQAGPVAALDGVLAALDLRERCLGWGRAEVRLENLEALRRLAVDFSADAAPTPAGFLARLAGAGAKQPGLPGRDVVQVLTWHKAKGLEWPVVVVYPIGERDERRNLALGVHVVEDRPDIDLGQPLDGRWLRYWPKPFSGNQNGSGLQERLEAHPASLAARVKEAREELRALYVVLTRARDRLVLPLRPGKEEGALEALGPAVQPLLEGEELRAVEGPWGRVQVGVRRLSGDAVTVSDRPVEPGSAPVASGPREHPPAWVLPSELPGEAAASASPVALGGRLAVQGPVEMEHLGKAIHGFLAADPGPGSPGAGSREARVALAAGLLCRYRVEGAVAPADLVLVADRLRTFVEGRWPGARWQRELPLAQRLPDGGVLRGSCDLALETKDGWVVVDHKSFPGDEAEALERARGHAPQLRAYADALRAATGRPVLGLLVHLPLLGVMAELN